MKTNHSGAERITVMKARALMHQAMQEVLAHAPLLQGMCEEELKAYRRTIIRQVIQAN